MGVSFFWGYPTHFGFKAKSTGKPLNLFGESSKGSPGGLYVFTVEVWDALFPSASLTGGGPRNGLVSGGFLKPKV